MISFTDEEEKKERIRTIIKLVGTHCASVSLASIIHHDVLLAKMSVKLHRMVTSDRELKMLVRKMKNFLLVFKDQELSKLCIIFFHLFDVLCPDF